MARVEGGEELPCILRVTEAPIFQVREAACRRVQIRSRDMLLMWSNGPTEIVRKEAAISKDRDTCLGLGVCTHPKIGRCGGRRSRTGVCTPLLSLSLSFRVWGPKVDKMGSSIWPWPLNSPYPREHMLKLPNSFAFKLSLFERLKHVRALLRLTVETVHETFDRLSFFTYINRSINLRRFTLSVQKFHFLSFFKFKTNPTIPNTLRYTLRCP